MTGSTQNQRATPLRAAGAASFSGAASASGAASMAGTTGTTIGSAGATGATDAVTGGASTTDTTGATIGDAGATGTTGATTGGANATGTASVTTSGANVTGTTGATTGNVGATGPTGVTTSGAGAASTTGATTGGASATSTASATTGDAGATSTTSVATSGASVTGAAGVTTSDTSVTGTTTGGANATGTTGATTSGASATSTAGATTGDASATSTTDATTSDATATSTTSATTSAAGASTSTPTATSVALTGRQAQIVLGICVAMGFTTLLDQSIFALAVPELQSGLHASSAQLQLIVSIYSVAFGVALVPAGCLGDVIGRRGPFLIGLAMFAGFSILGGLAVDARAAIASRLLQGLGAGMVNTQVFGLIQDLFQGTRQVRALGYYAAAGGLSGLAGPVAGGAILAFAPPDLGWRLLFLVNVPLGAVIFALAWRHLPRRRIGVARFSIDAIGLVLLTVVTLSAMCATLVGPGVIVSAHACLMVACAGVLLLLAWERRHGRRGGAPIFSRGLVGRPGYVLGTLVAMCQFAAGLTLGVISTLFFLDGLRISTLLFAALTVPSAVGMLVSSNLSWRYAARFGRAGSVAAIAAHLLILGSQGLVVRLLPAAAIVWVWPLTGLLQGLASGLIYVPNQAMTLAEAGPGEGRGLAAGFFQLSQRLACSICMAWGTGVFLAATVAASGTSATSVSVTSAMSARAGVEASRQAFTHALMLVLLLCGGSLVASSADWARRRARRARTMPAG